VTVNGSPYTLDPRGVGLYSTTHDRPVLSEEQKGTVPPTTVATDHVYTEPNWAPGHIPFDKLYEQLCNQVFRDGKFVGFTDQTHGTTEPPATQGSLDPLEDDYSGPFTGPCDYLSSAYPDCTGTPEHWVKTNKLKQLCKPCATRARKAQKWSRDYSNSYSQPGSSTAPWPSSAPPDSPGADYLQPQSFDSDPDAIHC
jgi:hypothetical protein